MNSVDRCLRATRWTSPIAVVAACGNDETSREPPASPAGADNPQRSFVDVTQWPHRGLALGPLNSHSGPHQGTRA
jgi:hypothetical protein